MVVNNHLVTDKKGGSKIYIKRHVEGGVSLYETIQDVASGRWVKATKDGNELVADELDATWFQFFGGNSHFVIQYFNPYDVVNSN